MLILATHKYPALFISYYNFIRIRMKTDALITPAKGNKILSKLLDTDLWGRLTRRVSEKVG